jgi:hypothetical protein
MTFEAIILQPALFFHLFFPPRLAISERRLGESFSALAFPPFNPPSRPKATAAGFFIFLIGLDFCSLRFIWLF